jgi:hypothetical protein
MLSLLPAGAQALVRQHPHILHQVFWAHFNDEAPPNPTNPSQPHLPEPTHPVPPVSSHHTLHVATPAVAEPPASPNLLTSQSPFPPSVLAGLPADYISRLTSEVTNLFAFTDDTPDQQISKGLLRLSAAQLAAMSFGQVQGLVQQWSSHPTTSPAATGDTTVTQQAAHQHVAAPHPAAAHAALLTAAELKAVFLRHVKECADFLLQTAGSILEPTERDNLLRKQADLEHAVALQWVKWEADMGTAGLTTLNNTDMLMFGLLELLERTFGDIFFRGVQVVKLGTVRLRLTQQRFKSQAPATGAVALQEAAEAVQNHLIHHATEGQLFRISQDHQVQTAHTKHAIPQAPQYPGGGRQPAAHRVPDNEKDFCISHNICLAGTKLQSALVGARITRRVVPMGPVALEVKEDEVGLPPDSHVSPTVVTSSSSFKRSSGYLPVSLGCHPRILTLQTLLLRLSPHTTTATNLTSPHLLLSLLARVHRQVLTPAAFTVSTHVEACSGGFQC